MRLFTAIDIPNSLRQDLAELCREHLPGVKWCQPEQLHLTLRFIGETDCGDLASIREALGELRFPAFSAQALGLGVFPSPMRPRILWVGFQAEPPLFELQAGIEAALQKIGLKPETKAFQPHLTLGRCKFPAPREIGAYLARHRDFSAPSFEVGEFHLYSSLTLPKGAEYRREASYTLQVSS